MTTEIVAGLTVEVEGEGEGAPIVCVHGLGGSSNTWTPVMAALQGHRIVRIDLPGSGRSPAVSGELNIASMADAVQAVCRELDITRATFLGHSMGTIVCQHIATHNPALVTGLALFGPLVCPPDCRALATAQAAAIDDISVPTLLVTGDQDGVAPAANVAAMAERIKGSDMVVLEGCGHWTTFERPQECMQQLTKFLSSSK
jgi:pimeloyl-ACP methyl ester carboxylesterase